jgi:hypothetical protein
MPVNQTLFQRIEDMYYELSQNLPNSTQQGLRNPLFSEIETALAKPTDDKCSLPGRRRNYHIESYASCVLSVESQRKVAFHASSSMQCLCLCRASNCLIRRLNDAELQKKYGAN